MDEFIKHHKTHNYSDSQIVIRDYQLIPAMLLHSDPNKDIIMVYYCMGTGKTMTTMCIGNFERYYHPERKFVVIGNWNTDSAYKNQNVYNDIEYEYYTYQTFTTSVINFGDVSVQSQKFLNEALLDGKIDLNGTFLKRLEHSTIIVDECQKLYSETELNTYGIAIAALAKNTKKYDLRIIYASGTPCHISVEEVKHLAKLFNCYDENITPKQFVEKFKDSICYYNNESTHDSKVISKDLVEYRYEDQYGINLRYRFNKVISYKTSKLYIYDIPMSDYQKKFDKKQEFPYKIYADGGETLEQCSPVYSETIRLVKESIVRRRERTMIYLPLIEQFGINMLVKILVENGFELEDNSTYSSQCKHCMVERSKHEGSDHAFEPMKFVVISGASKFETRYETMMKYNSNMNYDVILVSDVGSTGITIMNTKNIMCLTPLVSIMKLNQVIMRCLRIGSMDGIPLKERVLTVYVMSCGYTEAYENKLMNFHEINEFEKNISKQCVKMSDLKVGIDFFYTIAIDRFLDFSDKFFKDVYIINEDILRTVDSEEKIEFTVPFKIFSSTQLNSLLMLTKREIFYDEDTQSYMYYNYNQSEGRNVLDDLSAVVYEKTTTVIDAKVLLKEAYSCLSEHYPDDNINFLTNHQTKNRDIKKADGIYYVNNIHYLDGRVVPIKRTNILMTSISNSFIILNGTQYSPYIDIGYISNESSSYDSRYHQTGLNLKNMVIDKLLEIIPKSIKVDTTKNKQSIINELKVKLIDSKDEPDIKIIGLFDII